VLRDVYARGTIVCLRVVCSVALYVVCCLLVCPVALVWSVMPRVVVVALCVGQGACVVVAALGGYLLLYSASVAVATCARCTSSALCTATLSPSWPPCVMMSFPSLFYVWCVCGVCTPLPQIIIRPSCVHDDLNVMLSQQLFADVILQVSYDTDLGCFLTAAGTGLCVCACVRVCGGGGGGGGGGWSCCACARSSSALCIVGSDLCCLVVGVVQCDCELFVIAR
jgi:hypothetical protein